MLKKRDLDGQECHLLYELMTHPDVFPFVRHKAYSYEEFLFITKQTIEAEERGELISRTIIDEWGHPIGTINLFDIKDGTGFLGTWLGKQYHSKGYNKLAKEVFFQEVFYKLRIETIFMRIKKENVRSLRSCQKLPYTIKVDKHQVKKYNQIDPNGHLYELYKIPKEMYTLYLSNQQTKRYHIHASG